MRTRRLDSVGTRGGSQSETIHNYAEALRRSHRSRLRRRRTWRIADVLWIYVASAVDRAAFPFRSYTESRGRRRLFSGG